jgi:hypothetical protein
MNVWKESIPKKVPKNECKWAFIESWKNGRYFHVSALLKFLGGIVER